MSVIGPVQSHYHEADNSDDKCGRLIEMADQLTL